MANRELIFEELYRIREMMGVKTNSKKLMTEVRMLLTEGKGEDLLLAAYKKLAGLSDEAVTAFAKSEEEFVKLTDNILKASGKSTIDELMGSIASASKKSIDDLSQEAVENFLKNSTDLTKAIDDWALNFVKASFDEASVKVNLTDVFTKAATDAGDPAIKNIPDNIKALIDTPISARNADRMKEVLKQQQELLSTLKNVDGVEDLQRQINTKLDQIDAFQTRTPATVKPKTAIPDPKQSAIDDALERYRNKVSETAGDTPDEIIKNQEKILDDIFDELETNKLIPKLSDDYKTLAKQVLEEDLREQLKLGDQWIAGFKQMKKFEKVDEINRVIKEINKRLDTIPEKTKKSKWYINWIKDFNKNVSDLRNATKNGQKLLTFKNAYKLTKSWFTIGGFMLGFCAIKNGVQFAYNDDAKVSMDGIKSGIKECFNAFLLGPITPFVWLGKGVGDAFNIGQYSNDLEGFKEWLSDQQKNGKYTDLSWDDSGSVDENENFTLTGPEPDLIYYVFIYDEEKETFVEEDEIENN